MSNPLEKVVAQKKKAIEAVMDLFQKGAEVVASTVGEIFPLCEAAAPILKLALDQVESKEVCFVKEQFVLVRSRLDVISSQLEDIYREIEKGGIDLQYFSVEENIRNLFRKYLDILDAKPEFQSVKKHLFLEHFSTTRGEKNLDDLYNGLMGTNMFGDSVLEVVMNYVSMDRRALEDFCVRIKELFCLGLIVLLGHCALTQEEDMVQEKVCQWRERIQEVEMKMKEAIEKCVEKFAKQARLDVQRLIQEREAGSPNEMAQELLSFLVKKYDWVSWSVRIISHPGSNLRAGDNFQCVTGENRFDAMQENHTNVVVSYSNNPRPLPKDEIRQLMDGPAKKLNSKGVVEKLETQLPGFMLHAISHDKHSFAAWNFPEECHYWEQHRKVAVCVHSD